MSLFQQIREAQQRFNLTQAQFAQIAGIRETYMSRIMSEEPDLRMSTVEKITTALRVLDEGQRA